MKYRKRPVTVDAVQWFKPGDSPDVLFRPQVGYGVQTLEGFMKINVGDWVITGVKGEKYPCRKDIFQVLYDRIEENENAEISTE